MRAESALAAFRLGPLAALLLLALGLLLLLAVAAPAGAQTNNVDYDTDDDGLIEIDSAAKLIAIRYDLDGNGTVASGDVTNYAMGFPTPLSTQCPSSTCTGYELDADITLTAGWTPTGTWTTTFEGNGHTISGLSITGVTSGHAGLFSELGGTGVIRSVGLLSPTVTSSASGTTASAGPLAGQAAASSVIRASYVSGGTVTVSGNSANGGGLVGYSRGAISASYTTANVVIGGSSPTNVFVGGFAGWTRTGSVTASYAAGTVTGTGGSGSQKGGFTGHISHGGSATNSYCDSTVWATGVTACHGGAGAGGAAPGSYTTLTAQTTANLQTPTGYTGIYSAWNIDVDGDTNVDGPWNFGSSSQYPTLYQPTDYDADDNGLIDIANAAQLIAIGNDLNGNGDPTAAAYAAAFPRRTFAAAGRMGCPSGTCTGYELTADITLTVGWTPTGNWNAIFDGQGHTISSLVITTTGGSDGGLFSQFGSSAVVRDLGLISPAINHASGSARSNGALVGYMPSGGAISGVYVDGGSVETAVPGSNVGGLVGYMISGSIRASWSSAAAGISSGTPANVNVGGLVGRQNEGSIIASYASGTASGGANNGGLVGNITDADAVITDSYCAGATGNCLGAVVASGPSATRYTATQMQTPTDYTGIYANWNIDLDADGAVDNPWYFGTASQYPVTAAETPSMVTAIDYDAEDNGLIDITKPYQLYAMRWDLNGDGDADAPANDAKYAAAFYRHDDAGASRMGCPSGACTGYELTADVSLADYSNWAPIGTYTATFDGNGQAVTNLTITGNTADDVGLFANLSSTGSILRVGVTGASVTGTGSSSQELGILVGESEGAIRFSYTTGTVTSAASGDNHKTGGLVGHQHGGGGISASYSTATVVGPTSPGLGQGTGGLAGWVGTATASETGAITAAYASGAVSAAIGSAAGAVGGLVGFIRRGSVNQSYAYGTVTPSGSGTSRIGGLVGDVQALVGSVNDSYYDSTTSGRSDTGQGGPEPTADLQNPLAYAGTIYANWDVNVDGVAGADDPWDFGTASQYPALKVDFNEDGTDSAYEFGVQGRSAVVTPPPTPDPVVPDPVVPGNGGGNGGPSVAPPARGGGQPYNPAADHPEIYQNARYEMSASCEVRTTGTGDAAVTTATLTFDLGGYTRPITLALSLWDGTHYRSLQSLGLNMPAFQRDGQTATVEVVTDPAKTRFRLDGQYGLNLVLGYADCRTDDP